MAAKFALLGSDISKLLSKYGSVYLGGIRNTLVLAIVATLIGCVIGFVCGILRTIPTSKNDNAFKRFIVKLVQIIVKVYVEVFRGTPMILQAVTIFYGVPYFTGKPFDSVWVVAIIVVSINTGAYMAESVRGGILSVDRGQTEGAKALGMNHFQTMVNVILPQALRNIMPQIGNNYIINVKDTSVMFIIGFSDFFSVHKMVSGAIFKYFPSAAIEMVAYLCMTLVASILLRQLEKRMDTSRRAPVSHKKSSFELTASDQLVMSAGTYNSPETGTPFDEHNTEFE